MRLPVCPIKRPVRPDVRTDDAIARLRRKLAEVEAAVAGLSEALGSITQEDDRG